MDMRDIQTLISRQQLKIELSLVAMNKAAQLDSALQAAQHSASHPDDIISFGRRRKRVKLLCKKLMESIYV